MRELDKRRYETNMSAAKALEEIELELTVNVNRRAQLLTAKAALESVLAAPVEPEHREGENDD